MSIIISERHYKNYDCTRILLWSLSVIFHFLLTLVRGHGLRQKGQLYDDSSCFIFERRRRKRNKIAQKGSTSKKETKPKKVNQAHIRSEAGLLHHLIFFVTFCALINFLRGKVYTFLMTMTQEMLDGFCCLFVFFLISSNLGQTRRWKN